MSDTQFPAHEKLNRNELMTDFDWEAFEKERSIEHKARVAALADFEKKSRGIQERYKEVSEHQRDVDKKLNDLYAQAEVRRNAFAENPKARLEDAMVAEIEFVRDSERLQIQLKCIRALESSLFLAVNRLNGERNILQNAIGATEPLSGFGRLQLKGQNEIAYGRAHEMGYENIIAARIAKVMDGGRL